MPLLGTFMVPHPPIILPEVGHGDEKQIQRTTDAYNTVAKQIASLKPELIIVTSPHTAMYSDYFAISPGTSATGDMGQFNASQVKFSQKYDEEFTAELSRLCKENNFAAGIEGEKPKYKALDHGTMIPLYFVNKYYSPDTYKLVRIGLSGQSFAKHYTLGQYITRTINKLNRRAVIIASGDLSHVLKADGPYGFKEAGPVYDKQIMDVMSHAQFEKLMEFDYDFIEEAAQCGHRSFIIMAGALDRTSVTTTKLSYEGTFGVGYGVCSYIPNGTDEKRNFLEHHMEIKTQAASERKAHEDEYVKLARATIEEYTRYNATPIVRAGCVICDEEHFKGEHLSESLLKSRAGTFVSLKKDGSLRGCIGTIAATRDTLAEEIIHNAISACSQDPRFPPVTADELDDLVYSVDVLGPTEHIDSPKELDVKKYGVIVTKGYRRGLLLPNLEGVDTIEQQLDIACKKGDITMDENPELERFEVIRHK
jgi:AmmeMemoRadiSam system protein A/AmmeMemoRadiSam system protein B